MRKRIPAQIISYTILAFLVVLVTVIVLLSTNILRTLFANSSVVPIVLSILGSVIVTLVAAVFWSYAGNKREDKLQLLNYFELPEDEVRRLEQQASELEKQQTELEKKQQSLIWQIDAAELTKQDPRLAVIIAYQGIEAELQRVVNLRYPQDISEELDKQEPRVFHNTTLLEGSLDPESVETIKQIHDLRNRIVHGEVKPEEVSEDKATEYVQRAIILAGKISSLG